MKGRMKTKFFMFSICLMAVLWNGMFDPSLFVVLVTGASTGIEQVAYHYSKMGGQIVITARKEHTLQKVCGSKSTSLGAQKALYVTEDVCQASDAEDGWSLSVLYREHVRELMQVRFVFFLHIRLYLALHLFWSAGSVIVVSSLLGEYTTHTVNLFFGTIQHELTMQHSNVSLTITPLGLIDTESGHTNMMAYPASDAALHLITHQKKSFYPVYIYLSCLCRDWFPFFRDIVIENSYTY
uniref:Uncharacterized protein n=1 Tax=Hucho hucho TaxID=62062 RepID=A0A4W5JM46_9TELE